MLICEHHPPVYTVGLRERNTEEIKHELTALGAEFVKVSWPLPLVSIMYCMYMYIYRPGEVV